MNSEEAHAEFVKAYNRLCVAQSCSHMQVPEYVKLFISKMDGWRDLDGYVYGKLTTIELKGIITEKAQRQGYADFESTAEDIDDAEVLPPPARQLPQGES